MRAYDPGMLESSSTDESSEHDKDDNDDVDKDRQTMTHPMLMKLLPIDENFMRSDFPEETT